MRFRFPFIHEVEDEAAREDFAVLQEFLTGEDILKGRFKFFEKSWSFQSYPQTFTVKHGLGFKPKDVIQTSLLGSGSLTWNYLSFTEDVISVTITNEVTVRFFLGTHREL